MEAVLLAGGLGTRLHAVTGDRYPKCLAKVNGTPFLHYLLHFYREQGVTRFVLALSHHADLVKAEVARHFSDWDIVFSVEDAPLGTGGAIYQGLNACHGTHALVANADSFVNVCVRDFVEFNHTQQADMGLVCTKVPDLTRFGAAKISNDRLVGFSEKGQQGAGYINAGVYWLPVPPVALGKQANAFSFEQQVLSNPALSIAAYRVDGLFFDIGTPDDFAGSQELVRLNSHLFSQP